MTDLLRLAELCEKAVGADRELDALIRCACHHPWEWHIRPAKKPGTVTARYESGSHGTFIAQRFTASLDAAMTLVPEGWSWGITAETERLLSGHTPFSASVRRYWTSFDQDHFCRGATPALALCAAALRARASTKAAG